MTATGTTGQLPGYLNRIFPHTTVPAAKITEIAERIASTMRAPLTNDVAGDYRLGMNPYLAYYCTECGTEPGHRCRIRHLGGVKLDGLNCPARKLDAAENPYDYEQLCREQRNFIRALRCEVDASEDRIRLRLCSTCTRRMTAVGSDECQSCLDFWADLNA